MNSLDEFSAVHNNQLAFSVLEKELGIPPVMSPSDLANSVQIDKLSMVLYLTQVQNAFTVSANGECLSFPQLICRFIYFLLFMLLINHSSIDLM